MILRETQRNGLAKSMTFVQLISFALLPCFPCHLAQGVTNNNLNLKYSLPLLHLPFPSFLNNSGKVETSAYKLEGIVINGGVSSGKTFSSAHGPPQKKESFSRYGFSPTSIINNTTIISAATLSFDMWDLVRLSNRIKWGNLRRQRSATVGLEQDPEDTRDIPRSHPAYDDVVSCLRHSECQERSGNDHRRTGDDVIERFPCRCDVECSKYNDCCDDVSFTQYAVGDDNKSSIYSTEQEDIACVSLPRPFQKESTYMVTSCPTSSRTELKEKCSKNVSAVNYSPLLDIPVVSKEPHGSLIYQNIFCAKCHDVDVIGRLKTVTECQGSNFQSWEALKFMKYQIGQLQWWKGSDRCSMRIFYEDKYIRWCPQNLVKTCLTQWQPNDLYGAEIFEHCRTRTYYVMAAGLYYNNPSCVICNDVDKNLTECLSPIKIPKSRKKMKAYHLTSPFCDHSQIWNEFFETCEDAFCSSKHANSSCTAFNETLHHLSTINRPCTVGHYKRKYIVRYSNGSIYLRINKLFLEFRDYEFEGDWIAICKPPDKWTKAMFNLSAILLSMSLFCLALHMAIFICLPKRRNIPSMNLFSLVLALFLSQLIFLCFFHYSKHTLLCLSFATLLYYFLTAAFLWMNVLSIDIWRTFRSSTYQIKSSKIFIQYSLYAWGVPLLPTILVILIDRLAPKDLSIIPGFATNHCWFNNKWGHAVFFTIPAGIVVIINMFFYAFSVWGIYQQHKLSELATSTIMQNNKQRNVPRNSWDGLEINGSSSNISSIEVVGREKDNRNNVRKNSSFKTKIFSETEKFFLGRIKKKIRANKKNRLRLALYSKLALLMGMTWIFAFMSLHTKNDILEYLFIIFNGTQGTMIFIAFDCKAKIWNDLKARLQCYHTESFVVAKDSSKENTRNASYTLTEKLSYPYSTNPTTECNHQRSLKTIHEDAV